MLEIPDAVETDVEAMLALVENAFWNIGYHERELIGKHERVALVKQFLKRANFELTEEQVNELETDDCGDAIITSVRDFALYLLSDALTDIEWYEKRLTESHRKLAAAKAMMLRGNYTEFTLEQAEQMAKKRLSER